MKKQVFYKAKTTKNGKRFPENLYFERCEGYIYPLTDSKGKVFNFALDYDRSEKKYYATEITSGVGTRPLGAKTKEELLEALSKYDFTRLLGNPSTQMVVKLLSEFKEGGANNVQGN